MRLSYTVLVPTKYILCKLREVEMFPSLSRNHPYGRIVVLILILNVLDVVQISIWPMYARLKT